jgi:hypothetical protein
LNSTTKKIFGRGIERLYNLKEVFIMIWRDLIDLARKEKRMKERVKAARKFAVRMGAAATVGVGIGIILAPKAGKETRV